MYEQKNGQGSLFKNSKKGDNEKAPDYTGSIKIEGIVFQLAAWIKKPEGKAPFMSLSAKPKEDVKEILPLDEEPF